MGTEEIWSIITMHIFAILISGILGYYIGYNKGINKIKKEIMYKNENTKDLIEKAKKQYYDN